ncbi:MAG: virulence factor [Candidatus Dormibacteraeota bacterium]|nr:virulence factor [Candidatus Dormibacteraeota bacterium]
MAKYQVMFWKHIPAQVKVWDEGGEVKRMLPDRFQAAIDAFAMKDGSTEMDTYLEAWAWGDTQERAGSAEDVANSLVKELDAANPRSKLMNPEQEGT